MHTAVLQYSKYPRYPKKSAIFSVFVVSAIFLVSGKFKVFLIYQPNVLHWGAAEGRGGRGSGAQSAGKGGARGGEGGNHARRSEVEREWEPLLFYYHKKI